MNGEKREMMSGYAQASMKTGLVGSRKVSLVFTGERVIVAAITKELEKEEMKKAKEFARSAGKGMFGQLAASTLLLGQSFEKRYTAMMLPDVLSETPDNFGIPFDRIDRAIIKVDKVRDFQGLDSGEEYRMEVCTGGEKHKFKIKGYFSTVKSLMEQYLGGKFTLSR